MTGNYSWVDQVAVESVDRAVVGKDWLDQWIHYAQRHLNESNSGYVAMSSGYDPTTAPFIELRAARGEKHLDVDTRLLVLRVNDGIEVYLGGRDAGPDAEACEAWIAAAKAATASLGSPEQTFEWTALLGPPAAGVAAYFPPLAESLVVGNITLTPQPDPVQETGTNANWWWPILAEGAHTGYSWTAAMKKVAFDLRRLCGLLSVAFDAGCAVIREGPLPREWGPRKAPPRANRQTEVSEGPPPPHRQSFPADLVPAWGELERRPWLARALEIYHEGLLIDSAHPSLALVAYTAAIEAVGNPLFKVPKCPTCNTYTGVTAKFRATLRYVLADDEADRLGRLYSPRSNTVHRGWLHGPEGTGDNLLIFGWESQEIGFLSTVIQLRRAARDLLLAALRQELPPKRDLPPDLIGSE